MPIRDFPGRILKILFDNGQSLISGHGPAAHQQTAVYSEYAGYDRAPGLGLSFPRTLTTRIAWIRQCGPKSGLLRLLPPMGGGFYLEAGSFPLGFQGENR